MYVAGLAALLIGSLKGNSPSSESTKSKIMTSNRQTARRKLVSIISVVLNDRAGLEKTIASIRIQSFRDFELIVIDGGSSDGTVDAIRQNDDIIDDWQSETDFGIYDAMNKGLARATGEYVLFMNAGDVLRSSFSLSAISQATTDSNADLIYLNAEGNDGVAGRFHNPAAIRFDSAGNHQATVVRTSLHKQFTFDTRYQIKGDRDVQLRLIDSGCTTKVVRTVVAKVAGGGVSETQIETKELENLLICWRNRVGLHWVCLALCLAIARVTAYRLTQQFGFNWASMKQLVSGWTTSFGPKTTTLFDGN